MLAGADAIGRTDVYVRRSDRSEGSFAAGRDVVVAALHELGESERAAEAIKRYEIDPEAPIPTSV